MKKYKYFIHFTYSGSGDEGQGNGIFSFRRKINGMNDILDIQDKIKENLVKDGINAKHAGVTNFILL